MTKAPRSMTKAPRKSSGGAGRRPPPSSGEGQGELPFDSAPPAEPKKPPRRVPASASGAGRPKAKPRDAAAKAKPAAKRRAVDGKRKAKALDAARGPTGFGGWLWLLALGQLIVTARMVDTLTRMAGLVGTELWDDHPGLVTADLGLYGVALLLQLGVIVMMVLRSRYFKPLFLVAIVAFFLIGRIEPLLAIAVLGMDPARLATRAVLLPMAIELGVSVVWAAYVLRSRRVRNTFVR